jgi:hypothetical protein
MSELDVHRIICPAIEGERDELRRRMGGAEEHVLWLRRRLLHSSPDLPTDEYDGTAWYEAQTAAGAPSEDTE